MAGEIKHKGKCLIGIDSGATSTEVLMFFLPLKKGVQGEKLFKFAPINYNLLGQEKTAERLTAIIKKAVSPKGFDKVAFIVAGISGARSERDRNELRKKLVRSLKFKNIAIYPDTAVAFASVFNHTQINCGILIAGTGSILYYKNGNGHVNRVGGWGRFIGDEGSGYWIAREALNRLTQSFDKRYGKTLLEKKIFEKFRIDRENLIRKVYHNNFDIAKITRYVFDAAEAGDKVSLEVIKEASEKLVDHFTPLGNKKYNVALCGSLFLEEKLLEKYVRKTAKKRFPFISFIKPERKPVWGAVEIGRNSLRAERSNLLKD